jgi:hypothetical protein
VSYIKPSRSLNNKGIFLGLEFADFILLMVLLMLLRVLIPVDELLIVHLGLVFLLAGFLSVVRLKFRSGFIYSYLLGKSILISEGVRSYVRD